MACLVLKNDGIGDLVLASGLLADLASAFGGVDLVTCEQNREIAENIPGVRRCLWVSRDEIKFQKLPLRLGWRWVQSTTKDRETFQWLDTTRYEIAICLRRYIRQSSLILMSRIQAETKHCAWMYPTNVTEKLAREMSQGWQHYSIRDGALSELAYYQDFLESAMSVEAKSLPGLQCTADVVLKPHLNRVGLCISGNSTNWPSDYWKQLAVQLHKAGKTLVLFGGTDAQPLALEITRICAGTVDYTGVLTFRASVPRLAEIELLIGNDTGFTHFASLTTSRILVILGGGTFGRFFPWPETKNQFVIHYAMDCYDCEWQCQFDRRECLHAVPVAAVERYVREVLAGTAESVRNLNTTAVTYRVGWRHMQGGAAPVTLSAGYGLSTE